MVIDKSRDFIVEIALHLPCLVFVSFHRVLFYGIFGRDVLWHLLRSSGMMPGFIIISDIDLTVRLLQLTLSQSSINSYLQALAGYGNYYICT